MLLVGYLDYETVFLLGGFHLLCFLSTSSCSFQGRLCPDVVIDSLPHLFGMSGISCKTGSGSGGTPDSNSSHLTKLFQRRGEY